MPVGLREVPLLDHPHPPLNFARQRGGDIPQRGDSNYGHYRQAQRVALSNAVNAFKDELAARSPVESIELHGKMLIMLPHSQSKLSQQELADLQKATHFDKKELQQWYKGTCGVQIPCHDDFAS